MQERLRAIKYYSYGQPGTQTRAAEFKKTKGRVAECKDGDNDLGGAADYWGHLRKEKKGKNKTH